MEDRKRYPRVVAIQITVNCILKLHYKSRKKTKGQEKVKFKDIL